MSNDLSQTILCLLVTMLSGCAGCAWSNYELLGEVTLPAEQRHEFKYTVPGQGTLAFFVKSTDRILISKADEAAEVECSNRHPLADLSGKSLALERDSAGHLALGKADMERFKQEEARRACRDSYEFGSWSIEVVREDGTLLGITPARDLFSGGYLCVGYIAHLDGGEHIMVRFSSSIPDARFASVPHRYGLYVDHRPPNPPPSDATIDSIIAPAP